MRIVENFDANFSKEPSGCWVWTRAKSAGYGVFRANWKLIHAHRHSWELSNGPIPKKMCVLHRCDNPSCVNPAHLFLGTMSDNTQDMIKKGRHKTQCAEVKIAAKLSRAEVLEIRSSVLSGVSAARKFKVSPSTISQIRLRKIWKDV